MTEKLQVLKKWNLGVYRQGNYKGHIQTPLTRLHLAGRGFEPGTSWLYVVCSTTALYPRPGISVEKELQCSNNFPAPERVDIEFVYRKAFFTWIVSSSELKTARAVINVNIRPIGLVKETMLASYFASKQ